MARNVAQTAEELFGQLRSGDVVFGATTASLSCRTHLFRPSSPTNLGYPTLGGLPGLLLVHAQSLLLVHAQSLMQFLIPVFFEVGPPPLFALFAKSLSPARKFSFALIANTGMGARGQNVCVCVVIPQVFRIYDALS